MQKLLIVFLISFVSAMILSPLIIFIMKRIKAKQTILCYVEQHKNKIGTPTMGGIIFLLSATIVSLIFFDGSKELAIICLVVTLVYGGVGALDDGIKILLKRNLGLKAYQKIISQALIAIIVSLYTYKSWQVGATIRLPIAKIYVDIGPWYIPLCFFIYIATTNCVNLTDGLDGLAGSTTLIYLVGFIAIAMGVYYEKSDLGQTFYAQEVYNIVIFAAALVGGITAFLWFNSYKAKIFMGDTGSLALGGACAVIPVMLKSPLIIVLSGIMFVISGISVILQVLVFKTKKKRLFLMAPFHHHLEMKGINESKIVAYYSIITAIAGAVAIIVF